MPYLGQSPSKGDENNFKILDNISSYTLTFDGSDSSVVSAANDTITSLTHRFVQGQRVTYNKGGGTVIAGLSDGVYYIIKHDHNTIKLATSASNASNGVAVNITGVGAGSSHTLNVAFDGVNTKFKATHTNGQKARITRSAQLVISINGVIQQPHDTATPSTGFGFDLDGTIVFSQAPVSTDEYWAHVLTNNNVTFDISDNDIDNFTGDGSTTEFNLSKSPPDNRNVLVTIDGVVQYPNDPDGTARAYVVVENVLTFNSAPPSGVEIQVRHIGFAGSSSASGGVTNFYGRTGSVVLKNTDNIVANNAEFAGNLTVQGTMTTLDTKVTEVDQLEVAANNTTVGVAITQSGTGDILNLYDGSTERFSVADGGVTSLKATGDYQGLLINGNICPTVRFAQYNDTTPLWKAGLSGNTADTFAISDGATSNDRLTVKATHTTINGYLNTGSISLDTKLYHTGDANNFMEFFTDQQYYATNNLERMRIHDSYLVSIGATNIPGTSVPVRLRIHGTSANFVGPFGILEFKNREDSGNATASIRANRDGISGSNWSAGLSFHTNSGNPATADGNYKRMVITSTGNVGIGTEFPITKLAVMGDITKLRTNGETQVSIQQDASANGQIVLNNNSNVARTVLSSATNGVSYFAGSGIKVGIGLTNPSSTLQVTGTSIFTGDVTLTNSNHVTQVFKAGGSTSDLAIDFKDSSNNLEARIFCASDQGDLRLYTGGANERLRINSNGSIQVTPEGSTSNPYMLIDTSGDSVRFNAQKASGNNEFRFLTQSSGTVAERLRITSSGKTIISSPSAVAQTPVAILDVFNQGTTTQALRVYRNDLNDNTLAAFQSYHNALGIVDKMVITSRGRVGINTNNPQREIHVKPWDNNPATAAPGYIRIDSQGSDQAAILELYHTRGNGSDKWPSSVASVDGGLTLNVATGNNGSPQERVRIDSNGRVGLGITNPGDYFSSYNRVVMGRTNDTGGMTIVSAPTSGGYIAFAKGTSGNQAYRGLISYAHSNDSMRFSTDADSPTLYLDNARRVGINTTSPENADSVQIFGTTTPMLTIKAGASGSDTNRRATLMLWTGGNKVYKLQADASDGGLKILDSSTPRVVIDSSGNVSIHSGAYGGGGTAPQLYVRGTGGRQVKIHNSNAATSSLQITNGTTGEGEDAGTQLFTQGSTGDFHIQNAFATGDIAFATKPSGGSTTPRLRIKSDGLITMDNVDAQLCMRDSGVVDNAIFYIGGGTRTQTSTTTDFTQICLYDKNSQYNNNTAGGSWKSKIKFFAAQMNGGAREGCFVGQDTTYNNFSGSTTKMRSDLIFGTRGDAQTSSSDPATVKMRIRHDGLMQYDSPAGVTAEYNTSASGGAYHDYKLGASGARIGYIGAGSQLVSGTANTDFGFRSTGNIVFSTGGSTERLRITSGGSVSINEPTYKDRAQLTIKNTNGFSSASISSNTDNIFLISNTTSADGAYGASIGFSRVQYPDRRAAAITTVQNGTDEDKVGLSFWTHSSTDATANIEEKLRISATGVVHQSNDVDEMTWSRQTGRAQQGNANATTYTIKTFYYGIATFKIALSDGNYKWAHFVVEIGGMQYSAGNGYNATIVANSTGNGPSISTNQQDGGYHITITNGGNANTLFGSWVLEGTSYNNLSKPTLVVS